jgi:glycosyltransferase involved in cell wall biosynthesis
VDAYIAFTEFYRQKFIDGGLPEEKLFVKPHFVEPDPGPSSAGAGEYVLFVGRLDPEKGVRTLLHAWQQLREIPLRVRGNGRLRGEVELVTAPILDPLPAEALGRLYKGARFLVWPSEGYYETFGLVAIEAFAYGVPIIASRVGVMAELVQEGVTGLHFVAGDPADLAEKVRWAWEHPDEMVAMGRNARVEYETKYTAQHNLHQLLRIYEVAMARRSTATRVPSA